MIKQKNPGSKVASMNKFELICLIEYVRSNPNLTPNEIYQEYFGSKECGIVLETVSSISKINIKDIISRSRKPEIVLARHVYILTCLRIIKNCTLEDIGYFVGLDHSTISVFRGEYDERYDLDMKYGLSKTIIYEQMVMDTIFYIIQNLSMYSDISQSFKDSLHPELEYTKNRINSYEKKEN